MDRSKEMAESYFCTGRKVRIGKSDVMQTVSGIKKLEIAISDKRNLLKELRLSS
jgi:hypothetical protein